MDLVDEEDRALRRVGQVGHHVHLLVERRAAGHVQLDAQLVVQDGGERRLAQARGAVEEDVRQRLAPLPRRLKRDRQPLGDGRWPIDLGEPLRAELLVHRVDRSRPSPRAAACRLVARAAVPVPLMIGSRIVTLGILSMACWLAGNRVR